MTIIDTTQALEWLYILSVLGGLFGVCCVIPCAIIERKLAKQQGGKK